MDKLAQDNHFYCPRLRSPRDIGKLVYHTEEIRQKCRVLKLRALQGFGLMTDPRMAPRAVAQVGMFWDLVPVSVIELLAEICKEYIFHYRKMGTKTVRIQPLS